jgi:hypothetical protein
VDAASSTRQLRPERLWLKVVPAFALALAAAKFLPHGGGSRPPVGTLLLVAVVVTAVTSIALYAGLRSDLALPARVGVYAVGWNALVVLVKFCLAPFGMYEVNRRVEFDTFAPDDLLGAIATAGMVFVLYAGAYVAVYKLVKGRLEAPGRAPRQTHGLVVGVVVGVVALSTVGTGGILLPLVAFDSGSQYVQFVFSSSVSLLVGLALAGATALAALAFRDTRERAALVGDAAVLVTFFWVGLAFLALYHVLWVVYILVLTSTWPLRVVVPK